jgi:hypothetical protein
MPAAFGLMYGYAKRAAEYAGTAVAMLRARMTGGRR